jgi:hypothetical protein
MFGFLFVVLGFGYRKGARWSWIDGGKGWRRGDDARVWLVLIGVVCGEKGAEGKGTACVM